MEYDIVPNIITGKDLDYLSDMFDWNSIAYKKTADSIDKVTNDEVREVLEEGKDLFYDNMVSVLDILSEEEDEQ